ncbi:MAG: SDR family oxidoreductase [Candidatus Calescibacterium sp.]|nr:SDR family oxidoreductase [Candidatus Calescibacterium sp.]MCX7733699.1 SDR family oxidoreductase [bacterium]MDW8087517.1 NAD-dependent epimerase/dehydratase family protein [Candidatus Calescibacterium sp.]
MRCLITGANGFVGSNLIRVLAQNGYKPVAFVRKGSNMDNLKDMEVEIRYGDLLSPSSVEDAMNGCEVVFHVGAIYSFWERDTSVFYQVNVGSTLNILDIAKRKGVSRVVYTSTTGAIGLSKNQNPLDETAIFNPPPWYYDAWNLKDHYARSKILAQREVIEKIKRDNIDVVIVCPSAPIGWGDYKPTPTGLLILKFLNREIPFYADVGFSFVNVKDVAHGHILALEKGRRGEIYILGGHNIMLSQFFSVISEITGLRKPINLGRSVPGVLGYVVGFILELWAKFSGNPPLITRAQARASFLNLFYSSEKAKKELGYQITPIEDAIKDSIKYFLDRGKVKKRIAKKLQGRV